MLIANAVVLTGNNYFDIDELDAAMMSGVRKKDIALLFLLEKDGVLELMTRGTSMSPFLGKQSKILISKFTPQMPLNRYDIIVFYNAERDKFVAHRVFQMFPIGIITKGDNCYDCDSPTIRYDQVLGYVTGHWWHQRWVKRKSLMWAALSCFSFFVAKAKWISWRLYSLIVKQRHRDVR